MLGAISPPLNASRFMILNFEFRIFDFESQRRREAMRLRGDFILWEEGAVFQPRWGLMRPWRTASAKVRRASQACEEVSCTGMAAREPEGPGSARW